MKFQLFEVLGTNIFNMKTMALVLFFIFAIIVIGYLIGKISVKGVTLGTAAIFIVALFAGHFLNIGLDTIWANVAEDGTTSNAWPTVKPYFSMLQNLGLVLFVSSVGLIAGPSFFKNLKKNAKSYVLLGTIIILAGAGCCALITILAPGMNSAMATGLLSGSLTSTPAFAAAQGALEGSEFFDEISVGHAVAYPFGVIGVVLFVQIIPKLLKANMDEERAKLVVADSEADKANKQIKLFEMDKFGLGSFALVIMVGLVIGSICIPLGGGNSFSLGTTGGPLIMGLLFGHFGRIGKLSLKVNEHMLSIFQELGLVLFLIGAGVDGGREFVAKLTEYGPLLFVWGAIMTLVPMLIGFFFAKYVLKLSLFNNLGSICGGMTSTPALGSLISMTGTSNVASAYAATYPIALILIVLLTQFLTWL
ncbi:MAG: permease [Oscillospiraceae bacterium]|nr:permease [Oscillospiraceae bacterium]